MEVIDRGLRWVVGAGEELVEATGLAPRPLPAPLTELRALGRPLLMRTRRWAGPGWSALTIATIEDESVGLCTATVIGLPCGSVLPIVGVDLIALGGALSLLAVDLAPTDMAFWTGHCAPHLAALRRAVGESVVPRRWPGFAAESFSSLALIAGARRGGEGIALAAVAGFLRTLPDVLAAPEHDADRAAAARSRLDAWLRAERQNRKEQEALSRLFGAETAEAYLGEVFRAPDEMSGGTGG